MPPLLTIPASVVRREAGSLPTASVDLRQLAWGAVPACRAPTLSDVRVAVTGSHGLIGTALVARLRGRRTRRPSGSSARRPAPTRSAGTRPPGASTPGALAGIDAVVNLAGAGIGDHRWTDDYRREVLDSRVRATATLAEAIAAADDGPGVLLSGSAIGFYGDRGDEELDETSGPGSGFLTDVVVAWEAATAAAEAGGSPGRPPAQRHRARRHGGALAQVAAAVQGRSRRPVRVGPAVDELDQPRRRGRGDRPPARQRRGRAGQPHGADAGHQRRAGRHDRRRAAPPDGRAGPGVRAPARPRPRPRRRPAVRGPAGAAPRAPGRRLHLRPPDARARRCAPSSTADPHLGGIRIRAGIVSESGRIPPRCRDQPVATPAQRASSAGRSSGSRPACSAYSPHCSVGTCHMTSNSMPSGSLA